MLTIVALFMTSCTNKYDTTSLIPENAIAVFDIRLGQIWEKGDIDNIQKLETMKMLLNEFKNEDRNAYKIVKGILDDPKSTGLDLKKDICCYVDGETNIVVMADIDNQSTFSDYIEETCDKINIDLDIDKKNGTHIAMIKGSDDHAALAWDQKKAMVIINLIGDLSASSIDQMMNAEYRNSIEKNEQFMKYWSNRGDISAWCSFENLLKKLPKKDLREFDGLNIEQLKDGSIYANLSFNPGNITLHSEILGIDNDNFNDILGSFNSDLVKYMPQKTMIAGSMAINIMKVLELVESQDIFDYEYHKELDEELDKKIDGTNITPRDLLNSVGGSAIASLYDLETDSRVGYRPLFAIAIDIKNNKNVDQIFNMLESNGIESRGGYYSIPNNDIPLFLARNSEAVFLTDDQTAATNFVNGGYSNSISSTTKDIKNGNYFFVNLNINDYPSTIADKMPNDIRSVIGNFLTSFEVFYRDDPSVDLILNFAEKRQNSLAVIINFINDNAKDFPYLADEFDRFINAFERDYTSNEQIAYEQYAY